MVEDKEKDEHSEGGEENSDKGSEEGEEKRKRPSAINVSRTTN